LVEKSYNKIASKSVELHFNIVTGKKKIWTGHKEWMTQKKNVSKRLVEKYR
jgi:hypothetical protein